MASNGFRRLRTLLILGRVSNLPTVWSNCIAGWCLGGRGNAARLPFLFAGASFLYTAGMFLNDAFDVEFDRSFRRERPIPSGAIAPRTVWQWGAAWLLLGIVCLFACGLPTGLLGLLLAMCILIYDASHKLITFSPLLIGICRFFLYILAASFASDGITGWAVWSGLAMAAYISGLSFLARLENSRGPLRNWIVYPLAAPILLALLINDGEFFLLTLVQCLVLALWIAWRLSSAFGTPNPNIRHAVSGLLAGIVLVDWLFATNVAIHQSLNYVMLALFVVVSGLQRIIPAT